MINKSPLQGRNYQELKEWWPVLIGLIALIVPTITELINGIWLTEDQAHGPLILLIVLYLLWEKHEVIIKSQSPASSIEGWVIMIFGLLIYAIGRSQDIYFFEVGSFVPILMGTLLITRGTKALRQLWFPLFFIIFMIPLPDFFIDVVTGPLKEIVSQVAESVLYNFGYPIARNGVVISIGAYQLLVADACSGLHSIFSLSALGFLYLYFSKNKSQFRIGIIIASIFPIAIFANIVRVIILILVTYHFGDEAGQGFIHSASGILLFVISLTMLIGLNSFLDWCIRKRKWLNDKS